MMTKKKKGKSESLQGLYDGDCHEFLSTMLLPHRPLSIVHQTTFWIRLSFSPKNFRTVTRRGYFTYSPRGRNKFDNDHRKTHKSAVNYCVIYIYSYIVAMLRHQVTAGHLIIFGQFHTQIIIIIFRKHYYNNNNINHYVALSKYFTVSCSTQYRIYSKYI